MNLTRLRNLANFNIRDINLRDVPLVIWVVIALSIILFLVIVQFIFRFNLPTPPASLITPPPKEATVLPLEKLANLHLFGQNISGQDLNNLPQTTLQLELKGIYSAPSAEEGSAIIAVPGQEDHVYLVGDTLPGGAVLMDIYEDRVILRRAGKLEVLKLPQQYLEVKQR